MYKWIKSLLSVGTGVYLQSMSISSLEQFIFAIAIDLFGSINVGTFHNSFTNLMYFTCTQNQRKTERHQQKQWAFERVSNHTKVKYRAKAALDIFSSSVAFYSGGLLPWPFSAFLKKMRSHQNMTFMFHHCALSMEDQDWKIQFSFRCSCPIWE